MMEQRTWWRVPDWLSGLARGLSPFPRTARPPPGSAPAAPLSCRRGWRGGQPVTRLAVTGCCRMSASLCCRQRLRLPSEQAAGLQPLKDSVAGNLASAMTCGVHHVCLTATAWTAAGLYALCTKQNASVYQQAGMDSRKMGQETDFTLDSFALRKPIEVMDAEHCIPACWL